MSYNDIYNIFTRLKNAASKHERDYSEICIEWMRTLPFEAAVGTLFQTPEGESEYLNSIEVLISLASEFEKNKSTIGHICAQIDAIPLAAPAFSLLGVIMYQIFREAEQSWHPAHVSYIIAIQREMKNTILGILAIADPAHQKMLVDLFDKYILSLAVVGQEKALSSHAPLTNLGRRKKSTDSEYIIQSIADPDFSMRDFLLRGPISMFYGYAEPAQFEIPQLSAAFRTLIMHRPVIGGDAQYRNNWIRHHWQIGIRCTAVVRNIHGLKKNKTAATQQFKKLYPYEHLNLARVLIRLT